jgi:RNA polymerase sigma-70 factor (ECF subfamily)
MPLASDANTIRGIALAGKLDLIPAPRDEEIEMQSALTRTVEGARVSDEDLMALIRDEDSGALDTLFSRHSRLVFSIALRILRDIGEAEEVVQECFLYVYRKAVIFEPSRGSAKVWIVQVAYSRARDRKAHLSRRGFYIHTDIESLRADDLLTGQGDVEREIGAKLDFDRLQCAFEDLTAIQRETLKLFYFEDMGLREISEQLREPVGNVRHHFYRGLERLRKSGVVERLRNRHNG